MNVSFLNYLFFSLIIFNLNSVRASDSLLEVEPGVFAGKSFVNGEVVYFGMEKVDSEESSRNWKRYMWHAQSLSGLYSFVDSHMECSLGSVVMDRKTVQSLGYSTPQQLDALKEKLCGLDEQKKREFGVGIPIMYGANGFLDVLNGDDFYVVYASKKEVRGKHPFPQREDANQISKLADQDVEDIIMAVGSRKLERENDFVDMDMCFENRGIFRNPLNWFQDGKRYAGVSLKLHGFSALVRKTVHHKQYLVVYAVDSMIQVLLKNQWESGDFILADKDVTERTTEGNQDFGGDNLCIIKADALIHKYSK